MSDYTATEFRLAQYNEQGFRVGPPLTAWLCTRCGAVVVLPYVHDAHHATLDAATAGDSR